LQLHPTKTKVVDSQTEGFDFLGYTFRALRDSWGDQALALPKRSNTRSRKFLKLNIP